MSQQRNSTKVQPHNLADDQAILDAAYELLLAIGMRRLTMADIARQAGVSRATMYRRWPNVQAVVGELLTREFGALAAPLAAVQAGEPARQTLVAGVVQIVGQVRKHPLLRKIVDVDPEILLPYLVSRRGKTTDLQLALLESYLQAGVADGSVRGADIALLARSVLLTAWSFVFTGPLLVPRRDCRLLDAELAELLERYLKP
jgi:AcrR family transcriptional regulator